MAKSKVNPFNKYITVEKKAVIKELDGYEITYREPTYEEAENYQKSIVDGYDDEGNPKLDMDKVNDVRLERVCDCLIDPAMTMEDLKALGASSIDAILAIDAVISGRESEESIMDEEGK